MKRYIGERTTDGLSVAVTNGSHSRPLDPRLDLADHSPTGFECGYLGSGPAQLALAILVDVLGNDRKHTAIKLYQVFKEDIISRLPQGQDWEMTSSEVRRWVASKLCDPIADC